MTIDQNSGIENSNNTLNGNPDDQTTDSKFAVYDCEINLRFRLIEDKQILTKRDGQLLQLLLDALAQGADAYLEPTKAEVKALEVSDDEVSPRMRRHLMRLRNSTDP